MREALTGPVEKTQLGTHFGPMGTRLGSAPADSSSEMLLRKTWVHSMGTRLKGPFTSVSQWKTCSTEILIRH